MSHKHCRGGAVASILLTIVVLAGLGLAALVSTGLYVAHNTRVTERNDRGETRVETPFGSIDVKENYKLDPAALGVPVYPGAEQEPDNHGLAAIHFDFAGVHKHFAVAGASYRTSDSLEQVQRFYRDKLPHWMVSQEDDGPFHDLRLELKEHGYRKIIVISRKHGETHIGLASLGEPASN